MKVWIVLTALLAALAVPAAAAESGGDAAADVGLSPVEAAGTLTEPGETVPLSHGQPGRGDVDAPDKYWAAHGYPDDVAFAYEGGGELLEDGSYRGWWEIGLVDGDEARRQALLDLFSPSCLVTFVDCRYSYAVRTAALAQLEADGYQAVLGLNTDRIYVSVDEADRDAAQAALTARYGDLVVVSTEIYVAEDTAVLPGTGLDQGVFPDVLPAPDSVRPDAAQSGVNVPDTPGQTAASGRSPLLLLAGGAAVLLAGTALLRFRSRRAAVRTADGCTVVAEPLTRAAVVAALQKTAPVPDPQLCDALCRRLDLR